MRYLKSALDVNFDVMETRLQNSSHKKQMPNFVLICQIIVPYLDQQNQCQKFCVRISSVSRKCFQKIVFQSLTKNSLTSTLNSWQFCKFSFLTLLLWAFVLCPFSFWLPSFLIVKWNKEDQKIIYFLLKNLITRIFEKKLIKMQQ